MHLAACLLLLPIFTLSDIPTEYQLSFGFAFLTKVYLTPNVALGIDATHEDII
jgi:hypothetical protein